ncbi:protein of unknown function [Novosphingobium sp. CF614]|uniref:DUF1963 domain-containing protein n=1 Tax=Novosphingobium sp. CF614 TaxID=1884364 RepID=UPI0008E2BCD3|nr:DUF1963 domain-containing protein [Novosphingobium sp. CF614]SFF85790.1 protein of unknown function [Novosphingobium sp. CF614]
MKRVIAMCAVFGLVALIAAYVALAPHAPSPGSDNARGALAVLDTAAAQLIAIRGRGAAVLGLLVLGIVLSLLAASAIGGESSEKAPGAQPGLRKRPRPDVPEPGPIWRPEALSQEQRIAGLRRRAAGEQAEAPPPALPLPRPVVLVRKPRERDRDWFGDRSWLGGLPRLGEAAWPRDGGGTPLPFAAQIDFAELAAAHPDGSRDSMLPGTGSLAFFLGTGAVVAVPPGEHDFTDPPRDLPPAFDEGGYPFPARANRLSRHFFPFWPVEPLLLDLPEDLRDPHDPRRDPPRDDAIAKAMANLLSAHAGPRDHAFAAGDGAQAAPALWWHGASHLADRLHLALEGSSRLVALRRDKLRQAEEALALLEAQRDPEEPRPEERRPEAARIEAARRDLAERQADLAAIEAHRESLPRMIAAMDGFVAGRPPWQRLTPQEYGVVKDLLAELHAAYGDLVQYHVPHEIAELTTLSLRAMVTGAPDALGAMPEEDLARINRDYRLPILHPHQMFGLGGCQQSARDEHRQDILLLQLGYDDMMEWRWGEMGLFQFWISPADAGAGNWSAAELTFACA